MEFKLPQELEDAVSNGARKRMMSRSAYCRQALIEKLQREGIDPTPPTLEAGATAFVPTVPL
jgi:predicted transcriptional regulator